jgi:hypothetical protein
MTSNPILGIQPPPQQRLANAAQHSRHSSQASRGIVSSARKPGLSVDPSVGQRVVGAGDSGSGRPSPATSSLDSPNRSANGSRGGRQQQLNTTEAYTPQGTAVERPPVAQIGFPPRPGLYVPQRDQPPSSAVTGPKITSKSNVKLPSFEPPGASLLYPGGSMYNWFGLHIYGILTLRLQSRPTTTHGMAIMSRTISRSKPSSLVSRTNH